MGLAKSFRKQPSLILDINGLAFLWRLYEIFGAIAPRQNTPKIPNVFMIKTIKSFLKTNAANWGM